VAKNATGSRFMNWLQNHYKAYLDSKGSTGGFCAEWLGAALSDAQADAVTSGWDKAGAEMFMGAGRNVWEHPPAPEQYEMFSVFDIEILPEYTFDDATVQGGFRRVSGRWATTRHATWDAMVTTRKAEEARQAAIRKTDNAALLSARIADPDSLLWDHRDGQSMAAD